LGLEPRVAGCASASKNAMDTGGFAGNANTAVGAAGGAGNVTTAGGSGCFGAGGTFVSTYHSS